MSDEPIEGWELEIWDDLKMHFRSKALNPAVMLFELYYVLEDCQAPYEVADGKPDDGSGYTADIEHAQPLVKGQVKFDECAHLYFGDEGYWHTCFRGQVDRLGKALVRIYDRAETHFGGFA